MTETYSEKQKEEKSWTIASHRIILKHPAPVITRITVMPETIFRTTLKKQKKQRQDHVTVRITVFPATATDCPETGLTM